MIVVSEVCRTPANLKNRGTPVNSKKIYRAPTGHMTCFFDKLMFARNPKSAANVPQSRRLRPLSWTAFGLLALAAACGRRVIDYSADRLAAPPTTATTTPTNFAPTSLHVDTVAVVDDDAPLSPAQGALKERLETQLGSERPTHRITLHDHHVILGRIVSETPTVVRVRESFGYSGRIISPYKRADISAIEPLPARAFDITRADLALAEEFPQFHFWKHPPYTIVTDASFDEVEKILRVLGELRVQFEKHFADLILNGQQARNIHVVFFASEPAYRAYVKRVAPGFDGSSGFFSRRNNRLAILDQLGTRHYTVVQNQIDQQRRRLPAVRDAQSPDQIDAARQLAEIRSDFTSETKAMTERMIRHEGAHQLFHNYHVHSPFGVEPTWLPEGLAMMCEPDEIGRHNFPAAAALVKARDAKQLLPLATLVNHRDRAGFFSLGAERTNIAYDESWALVTMLMRDEFRSGFYDYIRHYRDLHDAKQADAALREDSLEVLLKCLKTDQAKLEAKWDEFLRHL